MQRVGHIELLNRDILDIGLWHRAYSRLIIMILSVVSPRKRITHFILSSLYIEYQRNK